MEVVGELDAADDDATRVVLFETVDAPDHRRLAGTGRTDDDDHLLAADLQLMSRSAWNEPKNLSTCSSSMTGSPFSGFVASRYSFTGGRPPASVDALTLARIVYEPIQNKERDEHERLGQQFLSGEGSLLRDRLTDFEHLEQSERGAGQCGVLEQADELPDLGGDHVAQRLGRTIKNVIRTGDNANERAVSSWLRGTDCRPPRTISAMYVPVKSVKTTIARMMPPRRHPGGRRTAARPGHEQQHEEGRAAEEFDVAGADSGITGSLERRPSAAITPRGKLRIVAAIAMKTLTMMPPHSFQPCPSAR